MTVFFGIFSGTANATLVGSGPPNQTGGSDLNGFLEADSFVLGSTLVFTQIQFWALQAGAGDYVSPTSWEIYSNVAGSPGSALFSGTAALTGVSTGHTTLGLNEYSYTFNVSFTLLPATYWLVLHNGANNTTPNTTFYWAWQNGVTGNSKSYDLLAPSPTWASNSAELAFDLIGDPTPEPASMFLVGGGLLTAWLARRRLSARA